MVLYRNMTNKGFTLVELLTVIAVGLVLLAVAVPIYGGLQVSSQLNETSSLLVMALREARENSASGLNNSPHGVYIQSDRYTLYQGVSFGGRDTAYDRETILEDVLSLSFNLVGSGGAGDINFSQGLAVNNKTGTTTLSHSAQGSIDIVLNSWGIVEEKQ